VFQECVVHNQLNGHTTPIGHCTVWLAVWLSTQSRGLTYNTQLSDSFYTDLVRLSTSSWTPRSSTEIIALCSLHDVSHEYPTRCIDNDRVRRYGDESQSFAPINGNVSFVNYITNALVRACVRIDVRSPRMRHCWAAKTRRLIATHTAAYSRLNTDSLSSCYRVVVFLPTDSIDAFSLLIQRVNDDHKYGTYACHVGQTVATGSRYLDEPNNSLNDWMTEWLLPFPHDRSRVL